MSYKHNTKHKKYIVLHLFSHFDWWRFRYFFFSHDANHTNGSTNGGEKEIVDIFI